MRVLSVASVLASALFIACAVDEAPPARVACREDADCSDGQVCNDDELCEPPGEVVTCSQTWVCGDDVVADNSEAIANGDEGHVFYTKPAVDAVGGTADGELRGVDVAEYERRFAEDCNGTEVGCLDPTVGEFATCAATCVVGGTCDVATAVRVRLN